jgi:hypothetical protein
MSDSLNECLPTSTNVAANSSFYTFSSTHILADVSAFIQCGFEKEYRSSAVPLFSGEWGVGTV